MLEVEKPKPFEGVKRLDIFNFIVGQVELNEFMAIAERVNSCEKIELKLCLL